MSRPRSRERRNAILDAATGIIATQGLSAATAQIAKEAGISTGSLFTYFETKAALLNALYVDLKTDMASAALEGLSSEADLRNQLASMWKGWLDWASAHPDRRRALAQLSVSDEIDASSRDAGHQAMAPVAKMLDRARQGGPMRDAPLPLVASLLNSVADATIDYILLDPTHRDAHRRTGFEALARILF